MLRSPDPTARFYPVDETDISRLCELRAVHSDLLLFWSTHGSANYNLDADGKTLDGSITNQLLGPDEVLELIDPPVYDVEDVLQFGTPFFVKLDREYVFINESGGILQLEGDGSPYLLASSLSEFLQKIVENPIFYDEHLPKEASEPDDALSLRD